MQLQFLDSAAGSGGPLVQLTKFNALGATHKTDEKPEPNKPGGFGVSLPPVEWASRAARGQQDDRGQFRIVWRKLAFEVDSLSYDKALANFLARLGRSFWSGPPNKQTADIENPAKPAAPDSTKRLIFSNLNGLVRSGEITAIIGPSGAGKTSLLNALCGRTDNYRGSIQLLGSSSRKKMRLSIIPQKDYLIENLTVRESLLYASKILNPNKKMDHEANIVRVVDMLNLTACFESSISRISGGEYKRVSIAQELLSQPDILILDEPTSGLDSLNCKNLIRSLKTLIQASNRGEIKPIAIVMTIHQPDIDAYNMFDRVYCMARGGRVIYDGRPRDTMRVIKSHAQFDDANVPPELQPQAARLDEDSEPATQTNPANLLIEIASGTSYGAKPIESLARFQLKEFENRDEQQQPQEQRSDLSGKNSDGDNQSAASAASISPHLVRDKRLSSKRNTKSHSFLYHTNLLTRRAFLDTIRDPLISLASLGFHLLIPIVMFVIFPREIGHVRGCPLIARELELLSLASNQTLTIVHDMQEELNFSYECGTMFFITVYAFSMCSIGTAALTFPLSMHVLLKEARNGWYDLSSFVTAKTLASFPFEVLFPVISIVMIYLMLGMPSSYLEWRLCAIALVVALIAMMGQTLGLVFGALFMESVQTTIFLSISSTLPQILVSGYLTRIKHMPWWLGALSWLSPYRYSNQMINMIRFGFGLCPCDSSTDDYLRNQRPELSDVPQQLRSLFTYYLGTVLNSPASNETITGGNATVGPPPTSDKQIPGVSYALSLDHSERAHVISRLDAREVDLFERLADQMARSFAFGEHMESCDIVRSQLLNVLGTPPETELPKMFAWLVMLLLSFKLLLFLIVKFKIGSRV